MAGIPTDTMSYWRNFFASANNFTVFDILDRAITVAAYDYPTEFRRQKGPIIKMIQLYGGDQESEESELGHGEASETEPNQALSKTEEKVEPPSLKLPSCKIRIKIKQHSKEEKAVKPCVDEAKVTMSCSAQAKLIEKPCVDEAKSIIEPKPVVRCSETSDEVALEEKLQATKRKLHHQYHEIEKAKREKRVQVLDYVPKQEFKNSSSPKPGLKKNLGSRNQNFTVHKRVTKNPSFQNHSQCNKLVGAIH